ncbi:hypothetical protein HDU67_006254 [Dinochytrium kinnereticum]|nr:hypothetical protein HDU67_006254 [Dinochytrium kinnereticum]
MALQPSSSWLPRALLISFLLNSTAGIILAAPAERLPLLDEIEKRLKVTLSLDVYQPAGTPAPPNQHSFAPAQPPAKPIQPAQPPAKPVQPDAFAKAALQPVNSNQPVVDYYVPPPLDRYGAPILSPPGQGTRPAVVDPYTSPIPVVTKTEVVVDEGGQGGYYTPPPPVPPPGYENPIPASSTSNGNGGGYDTPAPKSTSSASSTSTRGSKSTTSTRNDGGYVTSSTSTRGNGGGYDTPAPKSTTSTRNDGGYVTSSTSTRGNGGGYDTPAPKSTTSTRNGGGYVTSSTSTRGNGGGYDTPAPKSTTSTRNGGYDTPAPKSTTSTRNGGGYVTSSTSTRGNGGGYDTPAPKSTTSTRNGGGYVTSSTSTRGNGGGYDTPAPKSTTSTRNGGGYVTSSTSTRGNGGGYDTPAPKSSTSTRNGGGYITSSSKSTTTTTQNGYPSATTTVTTDAGGNYPFPPFTTTTTMNGGYVTTTVGKPTTTAGIVKVTDIAQCPPLKPREKAPDSVWDLRVDDIKVIMGVGDSIMAGFAAKVSSIKDFLSFKTNPLWEYRGVNFATGGEAESKSVANLLKRFTPGLTGESKGVMNFHICWGPICTARTKLQPDNIPVQGLNSAQSGAWVVNWGGMVDYLNDYLTTVDPLSAYTPVASVLGKQHYGSPEDDEMRKGNVEKGWRRRLGLGGIERRDDGEVEESVRLERRGGHKKDTPKPPPPPPPPMTNGTYPRRFKLAIIELGFNDVCTGCKDWAQDLIFGVDHFERNMRNLLRSMQTSLRDTVAVLFTPFQLSQLKPLQDGVGYCRTVSKLLPLCSCMQSEEGRRGMDLLVEGYDRAARKVAAEINAERDDGFAVLFDPGMKGLDLVKAAQTGGGIQTLLSGLDCFHPSKTSHDAIARGLWNNLFVPQNSRTPYDILETQYVCPTEDSRLMLE